MEREEAWKEWRTLRTPQELVKFDQWQERYELPELPWGWCFYLGAVRRLGRGCIWHTQTAFHQHWVQVISVVFAGYRQSPAELQLISLRPDNLRFELQVLDPNDWSQVPWEVFYRNLITNFELHE
jgi:hypothetical protein